MTYKPTGYPTGRPRRGEIRPLTDKIIRQRKYVKDKLENDPLWKLNRAAYHRAWVEKNPERARELYRNRDARRKAWKQAEAFFVAGSNKTGNPLEVTVKVPGKLNAKTKDKRDY